MDSVKDQNEFTWCLIRMNLPDVEYTWEVQY